MTAKPIIIDTDPGNGIPGSDIDDAIAIALALRSPALDLLGLTTVAGNVEVHDATVCALELIERAGATHVPVCPGAARPLVSDPAPLRAGIHARETSELAARLWHGIPRPRPAGTADRRGAVEFLVDTVLARPGEVTLVPIGPLTNIATALLAEPRLAAAVREIIWMGGAVRVPGSITPVNELNASYDPEATAIVLHSGAPLTLVPLDVTTRTCLTPTDVARIRAAGTPLAEYVAAISEPWVRYAMEHRGLAGCWLHDPLAVCVAIDPSIVRAEPMYVDVELASPRFRGQTVGWDTRFPYMVAGGPPNARVCLEVDNARFMALLHGVLGPPG